MLELTLEPQQVVRPEFTVWIMHVPVAICNCTDVYGWFWNAGHFARPSSPINLVAALA